MGIGRETLRSAMNERRIRSENVITVRYHVQSYLSRHSPDTIMCIQRGCTKGPAVSVGSRWRNRTAVRVRLRRYID